MAGMGRVRDNDLLTVSALSRSLVWLLNLLPFDSISDKNEKSFLANAMQFSLFLQKYLRNDDGNKHLKIN